MCRFRIVIYQLMQGNKLTINVRKTVKRDSKDRVHIKTEKIVSRLDTDKKTKQQLQPPKEGQGLAEDRKKEKIIKLRHTSVVNRKLDRNKQELNLRQNSSVDKQKRKEGKFPEIYNPTNSSAKFFDLRKYENKFKMTSTNSVIEKRKIQSEYISQKVQRTEHGKTELVPSVHRNIKLNEIEPLKEMSKEKKLELFKAIRSQFHELINTTNNLSVRNQDTSFKAYVEKGNNGVLVKEIIKKRWWWHVEEDKEKANLIWTQWLDRKAILNLNSLTICDETIDIEDYKGKTYEGNNKYEAVKKLVDNMTYDRIEKRINPNSNTYFRSPKNFLSAAESLKNIGGQEELKVMTVANNQVIHNHVDGCYHLHSKKLLFSNFHRFMTQKQWDPFAYLPLTFYIESKDSPAIQELLAKFDELEGLKLENKQCKNIWICKPGENSNRGSGIKVVKSKQEILSEITSRLPQPNPGSRSVIIQKYIQKCFLIHNRKFDIRCYILLTTANGILKGYWYRDGYIRTSSIEYNLNDTDNEMIHLTNDAVQKKGEDFGKHEDSNKLSFEYFKTYLRKTGLSPYKFDESYEQMKLIAYYLIASVSTKIKRRQFTFQLFGLDFMLDQNLKPMLIEANSNPCLSNHGKILGQLIHELVQNVIMTAIDPIFPPPLDAQKKKNEQLNKDYFSTNKFELIFTGKHKGNGEKPKEKVSSSLFQNPMSSKDE